METDRDRLGLWESELNKKIQRKKRLTKNRNRNNEGGRRIRIWEPADGQTDRQTER